MKTKIERRFITELRIGATDSQGDEMTLVGYASKFNTQSEDLGGFRETVMPGAFTRAIREGQDVKFLMNHDPSMVMGRTKNNTLNLEEDGVGLKFRVILPSTQAARDLYALVKRGDMDQCSFAFSAREQSWEDGNRDGNGDLYANRKLMDVDLMDVSAVTYPAYNATEVYAREKSETMVELRALGCPEEIAALVETRSTKGSKEQAEKAKSVSDHKDAATYHEKEAAKAGDANDTQKAMAHKNAAKSHGDAAQALSTASKDAFKLSHAAKKASKEAHGNRSLRSGNERAPFTLEAIDLPSFPDPDTKEAWWEAFNDKYMELMKKGGQGIGIEQAMAQAIAYANKMLEDGGIQTEVTAEVDGQGKDQTSLPYKIVDTDGDDDAADLWERFLKVPVEQRIYKGTGDLPDYVPADKKAQWKEVWNSAYKKAKKDGKSNDDAESSAFAQANGVAGPESKTRSHEEQVSDPDSDSYDPDDPDYNPDLDETHGEGRSARFGEDREGKYKTVAGEKRRSGDFAFVGDAQDPSTWKLPVHVKDLAERSLARLHETNGISPDQKAAVYKNIVAAAKRFGIEVTEENSIRCGYTHAYTKAVLEELAYDGAAEALRAKQRLIEIDLDL